MFVQEMKLPFDQTFSSLAEPHITPPNLTSKMQSNNSLMNYPETLHRRLELIPQLAKENIVEAQLEYKNYFDKNAKEIIFEVGSKV